MPSVTGVREWVQTELGTSTPYDCSRASAQTDSVNHSPLVVLSCGFGEWEKTNSQSWKSKRNTAQSWESREREQRQSWVELLYVPGEAVQGLSSCELLGESGPRFPLGASYTTAGEGTQTMARPMVANQGQVCSPEDIWQCLETVFDCHKSKGSATGI